MSNKLLKKLEEDREKALADYQNLSKQLVMVEGILTYLASEISKIKGGK